MSRILKRTALIATILVLLFILTLATLLIFIDPNDYRQNIQDYARKHLNVKLQIGGKISWSLLPLGIRLEDLAVADPQAAELGRFDTLNLNIDTFSLLRLSPRIHDILIDGLKLQLIIRPDGSNNWQAITSRPETPPEQAPTTNATDRKQSDDLTTSETAGDKAQPINFFVESVRVANSALSIEDQSTNEQIKINNIELTAKDIGLDQAFPLNASFDFAQKSTGLGIRQSLAGRVRVSEDFNRIELSSLNSETRLTGEPFGSQTVNADILLNLQLDRLKQILAMSIEKAQLANVDLEGQISVAQLDTEPVLQGKLQVMPFSLKKLLQELGQPDIQTTDPEALSQFALETQLGFANQQVSLKGLEIQLDQSKWTGQLDYGLDDSALALKLNGDNINVDRYLPPEPDSSQQSAETPSPQAGAATDQELLPVETIRGLNLDIVLNQRALQVKDIAITELSAVLKAKNGEVTLAPLQGKLLEGSFNIDAGINAGQTPVAWNGIVDLSDIKSLQPLKPTEVLGYQIGLDGATDLNAEVKARGNTMDALKQSAKGRVNFDLANGAITGVNLNKLACEGFARINQEEITKTDWPKRTEFRSLKAEVELQDQVVNNTKLNVENLGLRAQGNGQINIPKSQITYHMDIYPSGNLGDEACRVSDKVKDLAIPILCQGNLTEAGGKLCGLDWNKLGDTIKTFAKQEAKRKAEKEVDRAIDKQLEKHLSKDAESKEDVKNLIKGLFK